MDDTKIEWADDTANPWWGCVKASPACANCYAETLAARWHGDALWGPQAARRLRLDAFERDLERIARRGDREGRPRRVFIASMGDIFEHRADLIEPRQRVWDVLHRLSGRIVPMLLTKRPAIMAAWAKSHGWPAGAWAGTTVEDQQRADERVPELLRVPAAVRFLSCEPLLGAVTIAPRWAGWLPRHGEDPRIAERLNVQWIIVGGESGPKARPMHPAWARSLRDQAVGAGVPFHFKQWGEWAPFYRRSDLTFGEPGALFGPWATVESTDKRRVGTQSWHAYPHDMRPDADGFASFDVLHRVGKKAAGRVLDGRTWDEVPHVG